MLRTRHRERLLLDACIEAKQPFIVDNTNATLAERRTYMEAARQAGFLIIGFYFESRVAPALERNEARGASIPARGILGTAARLERPALSEGFDRLHYVRLIDGKFDVQEWIDEV
jgi:predicted kinase